MSLRMTSVMRCSRVLERACASNVMHMHRRLLVKCWLLLLFARSGHMAGQVCMLKCERPTVHRNQHQLFFGQLRGIPGH